MREFVAYEKLMGTVFSLGIVCENEKQANECLEMGVSEIKRIESLLSEYQMDTTTSRINQQISGKSLKVEEEVFHIIKRSQEITRLTEGCFDITASGLKKIYPFKNKRFEFPTQEVVEHALLNVGVHQLILNEHDLSVKKRNSNVYISFNAIGKGYASDRVKELWMSMGIRSGFVNASGDLCGFGTKVDGSYWKIGIADPDDKKKPLLFIPILNQAVATSGDYEEYFIYKGERYSHNINPKTGWPLKGVKSVSIVSPSAELSDALATAVYVMGVRDGMRFVNQLPHTHAIIIDKNNQIYFSKQLDYEACNF